MQDCEVWESLLSVRLIAEGFLGSTGGSFSLLGELFAVSFLGELLAGLFDSLAGVTGPDGATTWKTKLNEIALLFANFKQEQEQERKLELELEQERELERRAQKLELERALEQEREPDRFTGHQWLK